MRQGGFVYAHWDGTAETEQKIKEETKATIRNIPLDNPMEDRHLHLFRKAFRTAGLFAKAY